MLFVGTFARILVFCLSSFSLAVDENKQDSHFNQTANCLSNQWRCGSDCIHLRSFCTASGKFRKTQCILSTVGHVTS